MSAEKFVRNFPSKTRARWNKTFPTKKTAKTHPKNRGWGTLRVSCDLRWGDAGAMRQVRLTKDGTGGRFAASHWNRTGPSTNILNF